MSQVAKVAENSTAVQTAPQAPAVNPILEMIKEAVAAGQSLDVIRELKALSTELVAEETQRAFDRAIAAAKAEIKPIARKSKGHNGNYADLATVADAIDPILSAHGLNYRHRVNQGQGGITVTCILSHELGHREETSLTADADKSGNKNSIQAIGSTQTYLMRYTLLAALGLSTTKDDDGASAAGAPVVTAEQSQTILDLIERTGTDIAKFCEVLKINSVPEMRAVDYPGALSMLQVKLARQMKGEANA